jgi:hypothetical protein
MLDLMAHTIYTAGSDDANDGVFSNEPAHNKIWPTCMERTRPICSTLWPMPYIRLAQTILTAVSFQSTSTQ